MLHAAAGKLFANHESPRRRDMNGGIYSIVDFGAFDRFSTRIGTLVNRDAPIPQRLWLVIMTEYMEAADFASGVVISRAMTANIDDFADVASFSLQVVCIARCPYNQASIAPTEPGWRPSCR